MVSTHEVRFYHAGRARRGDNHTPNDEDRRWALRKAPGDREDMILLWV